MKDAEERARNRQEIADRLNAERGRAIRACGLGALAYGKWTFVDRLGFEEPRVVDCARWPGKSGWHPAYEEVCSSDRWQALENAGARKQRPLWASTGVKDKAYKPTLYVDDLVAPNTVNTMPEATLQATEDHGDITGNTIAGTYEQSRAELDAVEKLGISYDDVVQLLEDEGVEKFAASWNDLLKSTEVELKRLAPSEG